jgi:hypothetical protein
MSTKTTLGSGTTDTFIPTDSVGTEDSLNIYNFSDAHNWSNGIPVSGEAAVIAPGSAVIAIDDIASLDLTQLTLGAGVDVLTEDDNLTLGSLVLDAGGGQQVSAESDGTAPSTLTLSALSGTDGVFGADGTGASFIDDAADTGFNTFYVADGGLTELKNAPASSSTLDFDGNGGTLALFNPGSTVASSLQVLIDGSANKDVLELPGSAVIGSIHYGSNFLDVVTTAGTYDFTNVSYANGTPTGFSASFDHATGLEAITFTGAVTPPPPSTDTFVPTDSVGTEDSLNIYNFSDAQNWSNGIPVSGEAAVIAPGSAVIAIDDIASLDLTQLTLGAGVAVLTADTDLTLGSLVLDAGGGQQVSAESDGSSPSTVTLSALSGSGGAFGADGTGASFIDSAADTGSNTFFVADHGLTELKNAPASSSTLDFDSNGGTLALFNPGSSSTISSLLEGIDGSGHDVLELPGSAVIGSIHYGSNFLDVVTTAGTYDFTNVSYANGTPTGFSASFDHATGLEAITIACYARGTRIETDIGERPIEDLQIGDRILTKDAGTECIRWIGRRSYSGAVLQGNSELLPIVIEAGALSTGVPKRDLHVSPHHAMYIDGLLIEARDLVNGLSIYPLSTCAGVEYIHLELQSHGVLFAEGAASESYLDDGDRSMFDNYDDYVTRYGIGAAPEPRFCAPRIDEGHELESIRQRISLRAVSNQPAQGIAHPQNDGRPFVRTLLPEQAQAGVPGTVLAVTQPPPAGLVAIQ